MTTNDVRDRMLAQSTPEERAVILARDRVVDAYCAERGWNKEELSADQVLEIRKSPAWEATHRPANPIHVTIHIK